MTTAARPRRSARLERLVARIHPVLTTRPQTTAAIFERIETADVNDRAEVAACMNYVLRVMVASGEIKAVKTGKNHTSPRAYFIVDEAQP